MKKGTLEFIIRKIINYEKKKKRKNVRIKRTSESIDNTVNKGIL